MSEMNMSNELVFFMTEKCNSNCIMCPISEGTRKRGNAINEEEFVSLINNIDNSIEHIDITGGEPLLEWEKVIALMQYLNENYPSIPVQILTNGRLMCMKSIQTALRSVINERYLFTVPVHGPTSKVHDFISSSPGSFMETLEGLRFLSEANARTEIRIVGSRLNADRITETCKMISSMRLRNSIINIVAMEMTGSAAVNRELIWIDYRELFTKIEEGIIDLIRRGFDVELYNFPLCALPQYVWPLAKNSISIEKIRYSEECNHCNVRNACGGMFYSVKLLDLFTVHPVQEG